MRQLLIIVVAFILSGCSVMTGFCDPVQTHIWTNGIIPFKFNENVPEYHRELFYESIRRYEAVAPLKFVEYKDNTFFSLDHGVLVKYTGVNSFNSSYYPYGMGPYITDLRLGGQQFVNQKTVDHEVGHLVGLPHEHQRADRDEYIVIDWDNIPVEWHGNFYIEEIDFDIPYDPTSIMGYNPYAVAIDKSKPAVTMLDGRQINVSDTLTELDILKINELYCPELVKIR